MNISELSKAVKALYDIPAGQYFTSKPRDRRAFPRRTYTRRKIERSYYDRRICDRRHDERRKGERRTVNISIEFDERRKADRRGLPDFV